MKIIIKLDLHHQVHGWMITEKKRGLQHMFTKWFQLVIHEGSALSWWNFTYISIKAWRMRIHNWMRLQSSSSCLNEQRKKGGLQLMLTIRFKLVFHEGSDQLWWNFIYLRIKVWTFENHDKIWPPSATSWLNDHRKKGG